MYYDIKKQAVSITDTACDKFKYDISETSYKTGKRS